MVVRCCRFISILVAVRVFILLVCYQAGLDWLGGKKMSCVLFLLDLVLKYTDRDEKREKKGMENQEVEEKVAV